MARSHRFVGTSVRRVAWAVPLFAILSAGTWIAAPYPHPYSVNVSSFATPAFAAFGLGDPSRAIQYAAQQWAALGGAARIFDQLGPTQATTCSWWGAGVVFGVPNIPNDINCRIRADALNCPGGSFEIRVAACSGPAIAAMPQGSTSGSCASPTGCIDLHTVMTHEFGHVVLRSGPGTPIGTVWDGGFTDMHLPAWTNRDDPFLMSDALAPVPGMGLGIPTQLHTGFGSLDVEAIGGSGLANNVWGEGFLYTPLWLAQSAGYPNPLTFSAPTQTQRSVGLGFGYQSGTFYGSSRNLISTINTTSSLHESRTHELVGSAAPWATNSRHLSQSTLVHDTLRNQFWMLARDANHNNYVHLFRASSASPAITWIDHGAIPDIITRVSVGAAYDPLTDQIVVVWWNGRGDVRQIPSSGSPCTTRPHPLSGSQPFGCQGEYLMTVLRASDGVRLSTSRFVTSLGESVHGFTGLGPPAVICSSVGLPYWDFPHCEAYVVARSASREIVSWRFRPLYGGGMSIHYTSPVALIPIGGQTDFPISVSPQPASTGARTVISVTGSLNREVYYSSRQCLTCPWDSWSSPWTWKAVTGPVVRKAEPALQYNLVVGLQ